MNYVNYIKHIIYTPDTLHRRTDLDLPETPEGAPEPIWKRVASASLPFVCLYRPIGSSVSIGMGALRVYSTLSSTLSSEEKKDWQKYTTDVAKTALAIVSLSTTLFHFSLGTYVTNGADLLQALARGSSALYRGEKKAAAEELLQAASSALYLAFMTGGALEMLLYFSLAQAATSLLQSSDEIFSKGHYIEGIAKLAMACVRGRQAQGYLLQIQRRDQMLALERYKELFDRAAKGKEVRALIDHPLSDLEGEIEEERVVLSDGEKEYDLGSNFHGLGKGLVKGDNLTFRIVTIDGKEQIELDFKVNHAHRDEITEAFDSLTRFTPKESGEILALAGSHATGISVTTEQTTIGGSPLIGPWEDGTFASKVVHLHGLGSISFFPDPDMPNLHDRIVVRMDAGKNLFDLHEIVCFMNLEEALSLSTQEDLERIKIGQLFRAFFPKEATPFERTGEFFTLPLEELKAAIISRAPPMEALFALCLDKMVPYEILPGKVRYILPGLGDLAHEKGARALIASITGAYNDDEELFRRVAAILQMGLLSMQTRMEAGIDSHGLGWAEWLSGGADSVYTQLLTEQNCQDQLDFSNLYYGKVRILFSLKALDLITYQYLVDAFGNRLPKGHWMTEWFLPEGSSYADRLDILSFTEELQNTPTDEDGSWEHDRNEVMFKERLSPSFIEGLIVADEATKEALIASLRKTNLIQVDADGNETILGKALDAFIRVGTHASESLFS